MACTLGKNLETSILYKCIYICHTCILIYTHIHVFITYTHMCIIYAITFITYIAYIYITLEQIHIKNVTVGLTQLHFFSFYFSVSHTLECMLQEGKHF